MIMFRPPETQIQQQPPAEDWFAQFNQPTAEPTRSFDPSQASPNTGINGGNPQTPQPGPTTPTGGQVTMQQFNDAWLASPYPGTVDGLKQFYASNPAYAAAGITLGGSKGDKVYGPGGSYWGDAVISAGTGGAGKSGLSGDTGGGGAGGGMMGAMGPWMQPYDKQYALPTAAALQSMPGFQVGMDAFNRASQNSAAARGTLLNGRTNEAMNQAAGNYALQNYGMLASMGKGAFDTNYQIFRNNQNDPFDKAYRTAGLGKPSA